MLLSSLRCCLFSLLVACPLKAFPPIGLARLRSISRCADANCLLLLCALSIPAEAALIVARSLFMMLLVTAPCFSPLGLATVPALGAAAIWLVCVARLLPVAVRNLPPRAVAPVPLLANRPRLSLVYLRAMPISQFYRSFPFNPSCCGVFPLPVALACSLAKPSPPCRPQSWAWHHGSRLPSPASSWHRTAQALAGPPVTWWPPSLPWQSLASWRQPPHRLSRPLAWGGSCRR
jgi:hypothetical protein